MTRILPEYSASSPEPDPSEPCWQLWRQGDDGNEVLISQGHTRAEAEALCAMLEARGHKQLYWVAPAPWQAGP